MDENRTEPEPRQGSLYNVKPEGFKLLGWLALIFTLGLLVGIFASVGSFQEGYKAGLAAHCGRGLYEIGNISLIPIPGGGAGERYAYHRAESELVLAAMGQY